MAPTVPLRNRDAGAGYNANLGGQWTGSQENNDGLYRPAQYPPESQRQNQAGNGLYGAGQQGIPQQGSPSYTPKPAPYQQSQQGQHFAPPQQTQNANGNYLPNWKSTGQQGDYPGLRSNGEYQQGSSPQSQQQQSQQNPPVSPYNNGGNYRSNAANHGQPASNADASNAGDGSYPNQYNPDVPAAWNPTLNTNTMLPTGTNSATAPESASPTILPTASSTASSTSSPTADHNQTGSYQTGVVVLSAGLGVVLVGMVFAGWLHKRRRQQKSLPNPPKPSKGVPQALQSVMASTKGAIFPSKGTQNSPENPSPAPSTDMVVPSKRGSKSSSKDATPSPEITSPSADIIVSSKRESDSSIKKVSFTKNEAPSTTSDTQSIKSDPSTKKSDGPSVKERVSNMYTGFIGAAAGTGAAALGAIRKLKPAPKPDQGKSSNDTAQTNDQHNDSAPRDFTPEEKGDMNGSTVTLVASPTEIFIREPPPTLRQVPSGEPQLEHVEPSDRKKRASTIPEHDEDAHDTSDAAAESELKLARNPTNKSKPKLVGNAFASSHNLQSIAEAPSSSGQYLVEIDHITNRTGELNVREGQTITIRQAFDDGWVSVFQ